ncbi:mandelate racemase/muconate lactonizing enzyme family protein [Halococcus sp. IIIV-5B]|uniref:mandelate racemase/muconate lactonizing enzyme family protein n=1 Tax=Halococcus sp. IIIV-5B TaxID=2321230 RepID=UPI000E7239B1|nr:mandelate racemase/muconate lactonizing enzyme family protein [Halococcus sp. IIIV-5B]RJT08044.1 N-acylamino acid racemase [Halococcus sp. IIIV-5B]
MEITEINAYGVNVPLVPFEEGGLAPYVTNHNSLDDMDRILVEVKTDEGLSGWGEVRSFLTPEATISVIEDGVQPLVLGQSPFELEKLRRQVFIEYTNADMFFAPVEVACWDIVGKALDEPVYKLLGGWTTPTQTETKHRSHQGEYDDEMAVEIAYCLGILSPEQSRERAAEVLESGYSVLKTKAGRDWKADVARIKAMHDEVDGELEFRLDPNQGWTTDQAIRVGSSLADAGIYLQYMEQPIRVNAHKSLASLKNQTRQPIGPNEDTYIPNNLRRLIDAGAIDVAVLDLTPAGGIAGLRQQAGIVEDAGLPMVHHCAFDLGVRTAAILHAVSGIPGFSMPPDSTYYAWEDDVIEREFTVENGSIDVPEGPGLGIDIDRDSIEDYRIA